MRPKFIWETHMPFFDLEEIHSGLIKKEVHVGLTDVHLYSNENTIHNNSFLITLNPKTRSLTIQARWIKGIKDFRVFHNQEDEVAFDKTVDELKEKIEGYILDYISKLIS